MCTIWATCRFRSNEPGAKDNDLSVCCLYVLHGPREDEPMETERRKSEEREGGRRRERGKREGEKGVGVWGVDF